MESVNIPRNKILCGDCMEGLKELPDGCVDLVMMDPPYIIDTVGGGTLARGSAIKCWKRGRSRRALPTTY